MALFLDVGPDDAVRIGDDTFVTVERKSGSRARLKIIGTSEVELLRKARLLRDNPAQHQLNLPATETGD